MLTKVDLLPYVPFRMDLAREYIRRVQPDVRSQEPGARSENADFGDVLIDCVRGLDAGLKSRAG